MKWGAFGALLSILSLSTPRARSAAPRAWSPSRKLAARDAAKDLWQHGFDAYMDHAFPLDELSPATCTGQGPDWNKPSAIHFNDVNANVSMTLIDNLDSFVVLANHTGFTHAVSQVIQHVSFDQNTKPQVFEITIRALGGLLSGHMFASDEKYGFKIPGYRNELLELALDLGERLLPAFITPTGIPYARVNLRTGVQSGESIDSCTAGAGSLLLEFATLSRWTGDERFENAARRAFFAVWNRRSKLGLLGNGINVRTGEWTEPRLGGIGAGIDSFYEYALKMYVMTGEQSYLDVWNDAYAPIMEHSRGRDGFWYRTVGMNSGELAMQHIDSLGAFWPGLQVLAGDVESAIKSHLAYWNLWNRFSGIPETFNIQTRQAISLGYPLRPEFIESTYFLYQATHDSFYLDVGARILEDITRRAKVPCGLSTISNLLTDTKENRMESFALSESLKYLYLLFDSENILHRRDLGLVFTTEAHLLPIFPYNATSAFLPSYRSPVQNQTEPTTLANPLLPLPPIDDMSRNLNQCPVYHTTSTPSLTGSIRSRSDFEYARVLSGISVNSKSALGMGFPALKQVVQDDEWSNLIPTSTTTSGDTSLKELAVVSEADRLWWSPDGTCDVPPPDEYVVEWLLSNDGRGAFEDAAPPASKIQVVPGGFVVYNISGLRIQATARIDRTGYDVTQLGPYPVRSGQKVFVKDPSILTPDGASGNSGSGTPTASVPPRSDTPDIWLRFSHSLPPGITKLEGLEEGFDFPLHDEEKDGESYKALSFDVVAATATFGGNPGLPRNSGPPSTAPNQHAKKPILPPLVFGPDSPFNGDIHVMRPEDHNLEGCEEHHPGLRFGYTIPPQEFFAASPDRNQPPSPLDNAAYTAPDASVLFLRRGGCTFFNKLVAAKNAGFDGVIVWNLQDETGEPTTQGGLVHPSIDPFDREYADRELGDVVVVVVGREDGAFVDAITDWVDRRPIEGHMDVRMTVFREPPPLIFDEDEELSDSLEFGDEGDASREVEEQMPPPPTSGAPHKQILYINGLALRNAILV